MKLLLLFTACLASAAETRVEFTDTIAIVKGDKVSFEKHAAVYHVDKKLARAADDARKARKPVRVVVLADSLKIVEIAAARPKKALR